MKYLILAFLFTQVIFAKHPEQPTKLEEGDSRQSAILFKIKDLRARLDYLIERNEDLNNIFKKTDTLNLKQVVKLNQKVANVMERDFSKMFLKIQYELISNQKDCELAYEIYLRSEKEMVCLKEIEKVSLVSAFIDRLKKDLRI